MTTSSLRRRRHTTRLLTVLSMTAGLAVVSSPDTVSASEVDPYPMPELVALYDMDEPQGDTVLHDSGPGALDGTIGTDVGRVTGEGVTALDFPDNGPMAESNPDQLATVPSAGALNPGTGDYAVEVRSRTTRRFGNVVQKGQATTPGGYFKFEQPNGFMTCLFKDADGGQRAVASDIRTDDGEWHTFRCELSAYGVRLFVDGVKVDQIAGDLGNIANDSVLSIGGKSSCTGPNVTCDYFPGEIDYVRIERDDTTNQPPIATFTTSCADAVCKFDSSASIDPDRIDPEGDGIVTKVWSFGDGATDVGGQPKHTYATGGTYEVRLTATDRRGGVSVHTDTVSVPAPPVMSFTDDCRRLVCTFDSSASTDGPEGTIVSRTWDFGDGTTGNGEVVSHTYAAAGTYVVEVTGTDDDGLSASASRTVTVAPKVVTPPPSISGSSLTAVTPFRAFDTRPAESAPGPKGVVAGGNSIDVQITGVGSVPSSGVTAVAVNLAVVALEAPSFVTAWPAGGERSEQLSSLNIVTPGTARANLAIIPVGEGGRISIYTLRDAHLLGDVVGYFTDSGGSSREGRIITQTPQRLFDTRPGPDAGPKGKIPAGGTIEIAVAEQAGVPLTGASAVVLNLTVTESAGPNFVTVWPGSGATPTASSVNINDAGESVANMVIVPLSADGTVKIYSLTQTHVLADVLGYVTDDEAALASKGLFVPVEPSRLFDTREGEPAAGPKGLIPANGSITTEIAGVGPVPQSAGAAVLNMAYISTAPGFITLWPTGADRPSTSNVNASVGGDVRANGAILRLGDGGDLDAYALSQAHLVGDVFGFLLD